MGINSLCNFASSEKMATQKSACVLWTEPLEAKAALAQAMQQRPADQLGIGTIPLGRAFAMSEGWAEAAGASSFR